MASIPPVGLGTDALFRADEMLSSFDVRDLPHFSRTIFTASPLLSTLALETGDKPPLPHPALGIPDTLSPAISMVRSSGGAPFEFGGDGETLPAVLLPLLRLHKRAAYMLFEQWEQQDGGLVSVQHFSDGIHSVMGVRLSDDDLLRVLQCAEPIRGEDVLADTDWPSRLLDSRRVFRRLQTHAARLASHYIKAANASWKGFERR